MPRILLASVLFLILSCAQARMTVYHYDDEGRGRLVDERTLDESMKREDLLILGELHYQEKIQQVQAELFARFETLKGQSVHWAWEFVAHDATEMVREKIEKWKKGELSDDEFLESIGQKNATTYLPLFRKVSEARFFTGLNGNKQIKRKIVKDGLSSLSANQLPPGMEVGGDDYRERFSAAMRGHVGEEQIRKYFEAQCFVDSTMAWHISEVVTSDPTVAVMGTFHSDYFDGTVSRLKKHHSREGLLIKLVNGDELSPQELDQLLLPDAEFGKIADYLIVVD